MRASKELLQRILETANEAILVVNSQGWTEFANTRAAALFGVSPDEMLGRPLASLVRESLRPLPQSPLESACGGGCFQREMKLTRPGGEDLWVVFSRSVLRGPDGEGAGSVNVFTDVTADRRAQEVLQQAQKLEEVLQEASPMTIDTHTGQSGTVVSMGGAAFDTDAAARLHELLADLDHEGSLTIDLRAVRLVHDTAVARLARDLWPAFYRVTLLGFTEHHQRLMRYFSSSG